MSLIDRRTKFGKMLSAAIGLILLLTLIRLAEHWAEACVLVSVLLLARYVLKRHSRNGAS